MVSAKSPIETKGADLPAGGSSGTLKAGLPAPDFSAETSSGKKVSLADFRGKFLVLYFYPRDATPGCTREACAFRDLFAELRKNNIEVLGISADSAASHRKFREKQSLPFELLADEKKEVIGAYGAWGPKSFLGRKYLGILRITYLIGPDGRIVRVWPKVKPDEHAREILAAVKEIQR
jgi:peroxiredoxin Q/BCP